MAKSDIRIVPTGGPLGADAWGVDLERLYMAYETLPESGRGRSVPSPAVKPCHA